MVIVLCVLWYKLLGSGRLPNSAQYKNNKNRVVNLTFCMVPDTISSAGMQNQPRPILPHSEGYHAVGTYMSPPRQWRHAGFREGQLSNQLLYSLALIQPVNMCNEDFVKAKKFCSPAP